MNKPAHPGFVALLVGVGLLAGGCDSAQRLPLNVELGGRSVSKLPFVIAADQGLYEKYGLDVTLKIIGSGRPGAIRANPGRGFSSEIFVDGLTPNIVKQTQRADWPAYLALASNDCIVRAHIVADHGFDELADLKGGRIGISARRDTTTGFAVLELANRMGWDPDFDISIQFNGRNVQHLDAGKVDAIIASETRYAVALQRGYPILEDTETWNVAVGGNSVMTTEAWLNEGNNRDKARRFLQATVEGLAIFHNDRALALDVMERWYGIEDAAEREVIYERGQWMPRKPFPCYEGTENTLRMYDSLEMRKHEPEDFYDDAILRELDESGFIDAFYSAQAASASEGS